MQLPPTKEVSYVIGTHRWWEEGLCFGLIELYLCRGDDTRVTHEFNHSGLGHINFSQKEVAAVIPVLCYTFTQANGGGGGEREGCEEANGHSIPTAS